MYKIMIVDDEMIVRHAVKSLIVWDQGRFEYAGAAANGHAALEMLERTGADIVITDIKMPEMDGLELIRTLMRDGFEGEILVLSNYNDFELVREALKCGAHDYMLKLTLKTEQFMKTLEEMADKLDGKKASLQPPAPLADNVMTPEPSFAEWFQKAVHGGADTDDVYAEPQRDRTFAEMFKSSRLYSFGILVPDREEPPARNLGDMLSKTAEGLFPGHRGLFIAETHPYSFMMAIACPSSANMPEPQEIANRMIRLTGFYYNADIGVIYGEPASSLAELHRQLRLIGAAEELRFYSRFHESCIPNQWIPLEEHNRFREAESRLRDSLRQSGGSAIELWMESALLLIEISAELHIRPQTLKRAITGTIWGVANLAVFRLENTWNEKPWIKKLESAESDTQLMLSIREMVDEMNGVLERTALNGAMREEIRQAVAFLEKHFAERVSIADVAAHVGLSEPYLCQQFKAETGSSILTHLNEIRMTKAYELLASGQYLIKQAAIEVGIPDPFYFNRLFKKRYGFAPKHIKNILQEKMDNIKKN